MKIIFFGTPNYVLPVLNKLYKEYEIAAVVTQPPRPVGRKKIKQFSPIDDWAHKKKIKIFFEPAKIIEKKIEADLAIVAAYGLLIPKNVLNYFKYGALNIHPSLLPKWRGPSPVRASIIEGEMAGATIIQLDEQMDHGPIVSQFKHDLDMSETSDMLTQILFERSSDFLLDLIPSYVSKRLLPKAQDHSKATFTKLLKKEDGFIPPEILSKGIKGEYSKESWKIRFLNDFEISTTPDSILRFIKGMSSWPGAWTEVKIDGVEKRLKILDAKLDNSKLSLTEVQLESKNPTSWVEFTSRHPNFSL